MKADNYLSVVIAPESRRLVGTLHEYYFPFVNQDTKSVLAAQREAEAKQRDLARHDIDSTLACWRYCNMLSAPVIGA